MFDIQSRNTSDLKCPLSHPSREAQVNTMKLKITSALGLALLITIFTFSASAQRVGGYKPVAESDAMANEAADFAVTSRSEKTDTSIELLSVHKAERQTVQGANYRLCLQVNPEGADGEEDAIIFVQAVVYVDLKRNKRLISWAISDCGDDADGN